MKKYNFYPDSYDINKISQLNLSEELFLRMQEQYKKSFEILLSKIFNFESIDKYIDSSNILIPTIDDEEYNFYHKNSFLKSKYLFLRNNIHIENLTVNEIETINNCIIANKELDIQFLINTFKRVLYEDGDLSMFGIESKECVLNSKGIVFEFAYNQKEFTDINQIVFIDKLFEIIERTLKKEIKKVLNEEVEVLKYNGIPDIYIFSKDNDEKVNIY